MAGVNGVSRSRRGGQTAMKILEGASVAEILREFKLEGMDAEGVACHVTQRFSIGCSDAHKMH